MGIVTKDGIVHTPSTAEVLAKSRRYDIQEQRKRDHEGEMTRTLERLKFNAKNANEVHDVWQPIRIKSVVRTDDSFQVVCNRDCGELSDDDRLSIESGTLLTVLMTERLKEGESRITYKLACDVEY